VAKQLKEVAELLGAGLNRQLAGALAAEYMVRRSMQSCAAQQHGATAVQASSSAMRAVFVADDAYA
jgi:hypothetical protein